MLNPDTRFAKKYGYLEGGMDQSNDWLKKLEKGEGEGRVRGRRTDRAKDAASASAETGNGTAADDDGKRPPLDPKWNSYPETSRWLADSHSLASASDKLPWRIQGWLAGTGTSVWYGAGSTGKTQLMLWMAAMVASPIEDGIERTWMGAKIHGTGNVLVLTAEDTIEQIMHRLRDVVTYSMGQDGTRRASTLKRLHVMPFLSMTKEDFDHPNPSLFEQDKTRVWIPSPVMNEIERYILEWNRLHPDDDDRIIGVVMDSATSMSGFDSVDAPATTNFFFYLGRLCERLRIFWAVIGHTPIPKQIVALRDTRDAHIEHGGIAVPQCGLYVLVVSPCCERHVQFERSDPRIGQLRNLSEYALQRRPVGFIGIGRVALRSEVLDHIGDQKTKIRRPLARNSRTDPERELARGYGIGHRGEVLLDECQRSREVDGVRRDGIEGDDREPRKTRPGAVFIFEQRLGLFSTVNRTSVVARGIDKWTTVGATLSGSSCEPG